MQGKTNRLRSLITTVAVLALMYVALTWGRSWGHASHEVPDPSSGQVVWIATFNGL